MGVPSEIIGWIEPAVAAGLGPATIKKGAPLEDELQHRHVSRASQMAIFFRSHSFAAEHDEPELILAIYVVSVSSDPRSKGHF
jgi:hypothetical protein